MGDTFIETTTIMHEYHSFLTVLKWLLYNIGIIQMDSL